MIKSRTLCKCIFWWTIKQNNKGLLQRFMFNRMPRLQPFQSQFLEMKLQTRKHSSQPLGIQILVNRTTKISCFQVTRRNFNFREPVFPATWENWFQSLETGVSSIWESAVAKFQHIRSSVPEPEIPKTGNLQFQAWEALVRTGNLRLQDWEALVRTFGNQQFLGFKDWEAWVPTFGNR